MNNNTKFYLDITKEVSLINFFEYFIIKKNIAAIIFFVILLFGSFIILFGPASKKTYNITYEIYKSQNQPQYQIINSSLEATYIELKELDVDFFTYKLDSVRFLSEFNNYLNNKIFLYNFFSNELDRKKDDYVNEDDFIKFINTQVNSIQSVFLVNYDKNNENTDINIEYVSLNFNTENLDDAREILPKLITTIELQLKNDTLNQLVSIKNVYNQALEKEKNIIKKRLTAERNIYDMQVEKRLIYLNEQKSIAQSAEKNQNNIFMQSSSVEGVSTYFSDEVDLSLYFRKGLNVIEKEIEILQSRKSDYVPYNVLEETNDLIKLESKDDSIITKSINLFNSEIINVPFILYEKDIFVAKINNRFSTLQMIIFLFLLSIILTSLTISVILAYERTNQKIN